MTDRPGTLEIRTPGGIAFALPLAGHVNHFFADPQDVPKVSFVVPLGCRFSTGLYTIHPQWWIAGTTARRP